LGLRENETKLVENERRLVKEIEELQRLLTARDEGHQQAIQALQV
jgi:hypothetical protein